MTVDVAHPPARAALRPAPADGRLDVPFATPDYSRESPAVANFRFDPAPAGVVPLLTEAEALTAFRVGGLGTTGPGVTTLARFGLFTGNVLNPPAAGGTLTGTRPVEGLPAWLIVVDGLTMMPAGSSLNRGGGASEGPVYAAAAISDVDRTSLSGVIMAGGSTADLGIA